MNDRIDKVEVELRQEIKEINNKVTNIQIDLKSSLAEIKTDVNNLKTFTDKIQNAAYGFLGKIIMICILSLFFGIGGSALTLKLFK